MYCVVCFPYLCRNDGNITHIFFVSYNHKQPGECGSTITEDFTLQKDLECDCFQFALRIDGHGTVLNLNGHTVKCVPNRAVIKVIGKANTVMGSGTREYTK